MTLRRGLSTESAIKKTIPGSRNIVALASLLKPQRSRHCVLRGRDRSWPQIVHTTVFYWGVFIGENQSVACQGSHPDLFGSAHPSGRPPGPPPFDPADTGILAVTQAACVGGCPLLSTFTWTDCRCKTW